MKNGIWREQRVEERGNLKLEVFEVCVYAVSIIQN